MNSRPITPRSDVSGSTSIRDGGGGGGGKGGGVARGVQRTPSNKLYRQMIEAELATNDEYWDKWDSKAPVRLLSVRHLGLLDSIPGEGYGQEYSHATLSPDNGQGKSIPSSPSSPSNTLPRDFQFNFRYPMENGSVSVETPPSPAADGGDAAANAQSSPPDQQQQIPTKGAPPEQNGAAAESVAEPMDQQPHQVQAGDGAEASHPVDGHGHLQHQHQQEPEGATGDEAAANQPPPADGPVEQLEVIQAQSITVVHAAAPGQPEESFQHEQQQQEEDIPPPPAEFQQTEAAQQEAPGQQLVHDPEQAEDPGEAKILESSETTTVTQGREIVEKPDQTEVHVFERKETKLEEVSEVTREYQVDDFKDFGDFPPGSAPQTKEFSVVEEFSRVEVHKEECRGDDVKTEEFVTEAHTTQEHEVEQPRQELPPRPVSHEESPPPLPHQPPPHVVYEEHEELPVDVPEEQQVQVEREIAAEREGLQQGPDEVTLQQPAAEDEAKPDDTKASPSRSKKFFGFFQRKDKHKDDKEESPEKEPSESPPKKSTFFHRKPKEEKDPESPEKEHTETHRFPVFFHRKHKDDEDEKDSPKKEGNEGGSPHKKRRGLFKKISARKDKKNHSDSRSEGTPEHPESVSDVHISSRSEQELRIDPVVTTEQFSIPIESEVIVKGETHSLPRPTKSSQKVMDGQSSPTQEVERREIFLVSPDRPKSFTLPDEKSRVNLTPKMIVSTAQPSTSASPSSPTTTQTLGPNDSFDTAIARSSRSSVDSGTASDPARPAGHFVVVAIDFGTTFSGYAFSFTRDPASIHMMRKWEGGDPGVINQKTPTALLLDPDGKFHSFGFTARDFFHDLDPQESKKWLYFEKFKMTLHYNADLNTDTMVKASNGKMMPALTVFSHALHFFKQHSLMELSDQSATKIINEDVRWVITVPAIWKASAKAFMRQAAYDAGIASREYPDQLLIALEPEAASIYVRRLRMHQLVPEKLVKRPLSPRKGSTGSAPEFMNTDKVSDEFRSEEDYVHSALCTVLEHRDAPCVYPINSETVAIEVQQSGTRYMVVDCGGGTVDITVHEMESRHGNLIELYKASGGPFGSVGVDNEFEKLLIAIFGQDFIDAFRYKRPAGWVDLMIAFESRKRAASPYKSNPLNVSLPFSFIDYHKKYRGGQVEGVIRKFGDREVRWSSQGMLRLTPDAMHKLFTPTLEKIKQSVGDVLNNPGVKDIQYMFLVGGFSESAMLQQAMRREFGHLLKIVIPQDVALTILKGAVCFGLDPTVVNVRKSRMTYGVGVLNRFLKGKHPKDKLVKKDGVEWCTDVYDKFVLTDQSVALGDTVLRSYTPAKPGQKSSIINIFCSEQNDTQFITDKGVSKVGTLCLDLTDVQYQQNMPKRREIQTRMIFGDTEIKVSALDVATGKCVRAGIDFLNK